MAKLKDRSVLEYRTKLQEGGRVVIPAALRKMLGLGVGDNLTLDIREGELRISSQRMALEAIRAVVRKQSRRKRKGLSMVDALIAERRREAKRELKEAKRVRLRSR
ncbi:MAG: AbrB/MazE/SpoVT family DNA-binding domain-containing protein [Proteobacteria bacterium]|nr:AbrB/MazE/SpoVT family DNA-binding domain-containing protein [Pseudomonadota bacterium]